MKSPIYVTQPSLAPLEEFLPYLESIWETGIMTHNGPMVQKLEKALSEYLNVPHVVCVANGTCALQLAIRALDLTGEIITTPFSFIATANIIAWERCRPVFVDIDPGTWNIDPDLIEKNITPQTTAILPVHVFSVPCDVERIQAIANKQGLKTIYDSAHAIATNFQGKSLLSYGDISAVSFHATKLFNTAEGGACITNNAQLAERLRQMRFFGFNSQKEIVDDGMNAKMTEVNAALGLANLKWIEKVKQDRQEKYELYQKLLSQISGISFQTFNPNSYNYSYMPVLFENETLLLKVKERLEKQNIYPRRYFYPSLNQVDIFNSQTSLPVSEQIARTVLCLPLYYKLSIEDIQFICQSIS
jgi:hypothetical protein